MYCNLCGEEIDMPYSCNYCDRRHCSKHRLPENHNCFGRRLSSQDSRHFESEFNDSVGGTGNKKRARERSQPTSGRRTGGAGTRPPQTNSTQSEGGDTSLQIIRALLIIGVAFAIAFAALFTYGVLSPGDDGGGGPTAGVKTTQQVEEAAAGGGTTVSPEATPTNRPDESRAEKIEAMIHERINQVRGERGLSALQHDSDLEAIADYHSEDMATQGYFAHDSPDGESMQDRYQQFEYQCRVETGNGQYATGAENIFKFSYSGWGISEEEIAERAVTGWMNSDGHRENILRSYWEREGIGVFIEEEGGETVVYATQNFC